MKKSAQADDETPDYDAVARRAHEIFVLRGSAPGRDVEDWLEAEEQLRAERRPRAKRKKTKAQS